MPCTLTGSIEGDEALAYREQAEGANSTITELTQILCIQLQHLERTGNTSLIAGRARKWWKAHKKQDSRRAGEERRKQIENCQRKAALAKLSASDRKLLNL